ncbi:hypothetical protein [Corynebacterium sp.]|uniref:hypothetical protein n=1 Tax=Corynebacterium sp. TaxID=1720 RepID=UPI0026DC0FAA|nr:hypothetical protein [Corynebacterium sp.]MDO5032651.1 hypothetical protein [Corynebacterium sp.]
MDALLSAFDFLDLPDLLEHTEPAEVPTPGFDEARYLREGQAAVTALSAEGRWSAIPSFHELSVECTLYRATPYMAVLEGESWRFAALADAPFALPGANPAGGERVRATVSPAFVLLSAEDAGASHAAGTESSLVAPTTERFYRNYRPSELTPHVEITGEVTSAQRREGTVSEYWVNTVAGWPVIAPEELSGRVHVRTVAVCATGFWDSL